MGENKNIYIRQIKPEIFIKPAHEEECQISRTDTKYLFKSTPELKINKQTNMERAPYITDNINLE